MGTKHIISIVAFLSLLQTVIYSQTNSLNSDFELGNFTNWSAQNGSWDRNRDIEFTDNIFRNNRQTIVSELTMDRYTCYELPTIPPNGGNYVARLGNHYKGGQVERLIYPLTIDQTNTLFMYRYAVVFEDPGHDDDEQPFFRLEITDESGDVIDPVCGYYNVVSGGNIPGFKTCEIYIDDDTDDRDGDSDTIVRWKPWTTVAIDLSAYIGQTIKLQFTNADCKLTGHWAYSYMEVITNKIELELEACEGDNAGTLIAPEGFSSYLWNTGETTREIEINNLQEGDRYYCDMYTLPECSVRLESTIKIQKVSIGISDTTICRGTQAIITATGADDYVWSNGDTGETLVVSPTTSTQYTVTGTTDYGCSSQSVINVNVINSPNVNVNSTEICIGDTTSLTANGAVNYEWEDGKETTTSITVSPTETAEYKVTGTASNGCKDSAIATVVVNEPLTPSISIVADKNNICEGELITFTVDDVKNQGLDPILQWYVNDIYVSDNIEIASDTLSNNSEVKLVITATEHCYTTNPVADSIMLQLIPNQAPHIELKASPSGICEKTLTSFITQNVSGAGTSPSYEWLINGTSIASTKSYISTDTLSAGSVVTVVVHSNAACPLPETDTAQLVVNPKPDPEITIQPDICREADPTPISVKDNRNTGGNYTIAHSPGVEENAGSWVFNPNLPDKSYSISATWTNDFGCIASTSATINVHSIEAPSVPPFYSDLIGYLPYKTFEATGTGNIQWFDNSYAGIGNGGSYTPVIDCKIEDIECEYVYYVNQVLEPWGCVSPYKKVTYTLTACKVESPEVQNYFVCDYETIPELHADTASIWTKAPLMGESTLYWYTHSNDAYSNFIHSGLSDYKPAIQATEGVFSYWVRQYNTTYACYSPPSEVQLEIFKTPPPSIENSPQTYCEGYASPIAFVANGSNIKWYEKPGNQSSVFKIGNELMPTIPTDGVDTYYASQTINDCVSPPVPAVISIVPPPSAPYISDSKSCEDESYHYLVAVYPENTQIKWYDTDGVELDRDTDTLTLQKNWLNIDDISIFKAILTNSPDCPSDTSKAGYELISVPNDPLVFKDDIICLNEDLEPFITKTDLNIDSVVWYNDKVRIFEGDSLYLDNPKEGDVYNLEVFVYHKDCENNASIAPIKIHNMPKPVIFGDSIYCTNSIQKQYSVPSGDISNSEYNFNWRVLSTDSITTYNATEGSSAPYAYVDWMLPGIDTVVVKQYDNVCANYDTMVVTVVEPPVADFDYAIYNTYYATFFYNTSVQSPVIDGDYERDFAVNYLWNFNFPHDTILFEQLHEDYDESIRRKYSYGYYDIMLIAKNEVGCADTILQKVFMDQFLSLYVPNVFSPYDDAPFVRQFHPTGMGLESYKISIYDKWGNFIWYSEELTDEGTPGEGWDGFYDGQVMQQGSYIWKIEATFIDGSIWKGVEQANGEFSTWGSVLLLR